MSELYPLKFTPIFKDKIWGADILKKYFPCKDSKSDRCGESWEISGVQDNISVVANGFLQGNTLEELVEIYMDELVGESVYEQFGIEFPLLVKFINTSDVLSVQVHPGDEIARERHDAYGKTEMWYIVDAKPDATLYVGLNEDVDKDTFVGIISDNSLKDILNVEQVKNGDVFFIPSGRIHAIGDGILLAEIQQTSDITYRLYDWDRLDLDGKLRELHTDFAIDVVELEKKDTYKTSYEPCLNSSTELVDCKYFTTNYLAFDKVINKDYSELDSFVIYMNLNGSFKIKYNEDETIKVEKGETILIPAIFDSIQLIPDTDKVELLEIFISGIER